MQASDLPTVAAAAPGALRGIRMIELGRHIAGPFCGRPPGEFGAGVIAIEAPGTGDRLRNRRLLEDGTPAWWQVQSCNPRSMALDLGKPDGRNIVRRLAAEPDLPIENFRSGTMEGRGLGSEDRSALDPKLVVRRSSGYGRTGPYRRRRHRRRAGRQGTVRGGHRRTEEKGIVA